MVNGQPESNKGLFLGQSICHSEDSTNAFNGH